MLLFINQIVDGDPLIKQDSLESLFYPMNIALVEQLGMEGYHVDIII